MVVFLEQCVAGQVRRLREGRRRASRARRAGSVAALFGGTLALALLFPAPRLWEERAAPAIAMDEQLPRVESEEVLAAQPKLLFEALTGLEERTPGVAAEVEEPVQTASNLLSVPRIS